MQYLVKQYIQLKAKFKDRASYISAWLRATYIKSAFTIFTPSNIFLANTCANENKYFVNQNRRHVDDAREICVRIRVCFYLINKLCLSLKQYICIQVRLSCVFYFVYFVIDWMFKNTFQFSMFFSPFACLCTMS
jgi:hypothetical protein